MNLTRGCFFFSSCLVLSMGVMQQAEAAEQPYQVEWSTQIGTESDDQSWSVAVDAAGNAYISGYTKGNLEGTNAGLSDAFLSKFDPSGVELWTTQIGTTGTDRSFSVVVDTAGNAYISGWTAGDLGGSNVGLTDAFLSKFDPSGNELWTRQIGTSSQEISYSVAVDAAGNAYISGFTKGGLGGPNAGDKDAFLCKFDPLGNELWSTQIGSRFDDGSSSVAVDAAGNAYISGYTDLDLNDTAGLNPFLSKFDPSGNELWYTQIGTTRDDVSHSVAVDAAGNAYISGFTSGSLGGPNAGGWDAFLTKFTIPEPASLVLLAIGAPALLQRREL